MSLFWKEEYDFAERWRAAFAAKDARAAELAKEYLKEYFACYPEREEEDPPEKAGHDFPPEDPDEFQKELAETDSGYALQAAVCVNCTLLTRMERPLSEAENRQWCFRLERMLERESCLFSANLFLFRGTLQSMRLRSNRAVFCSVCFPWEECSQTLTIDRTGCAALRAWSRDKAFPGRKRTYAIGKDAAQSLLNQVAASFAGEREDLIAFDAGTWSLELINTEGRSYLFEGSLYGGSGDVQTRLSNLIRETLGTNSLFAFDESWQPEDAIRSLKLELRNPDERASEANQPDEWLLLDSDAGTVEWTDRRRSYGRAWHRYEFPGSLSENLRHFGDRRLFQQPEIPAGELIPRFEAVPLYTLTVEFAAGTKQVLEGHYDRSELPEHFGDLIKWLTAMLHHLDNGSMLEPERYDKARRRQGQLIYCSVSFHSGGKRYYYRAEDDDFRVNDEVVVPAGKDNRPTLAKIEKVEYFAPEGAPRPAEQTKCILRRADERDRMELR